MRAPSILCRLRRDARGVAFLEFAIRLPLFMLVLFGTLEVANKMIAQMKIQRLATMTADMIAQRGASETPMNEAQVYDIINAIDVASKPFDVRRNGRIIITAVLGEDTDGNLTADRNAIKWQRFDGDLVSTVPILGCGTTNPVATMARSMGYNEALFHVQVAYQYTPMLPPEVTTLLGMNTLIQTTATFRGRGSIFKPILSVDGYTAKSNCNTARGT
jgi:Flp pilus assembly protein TadG